ncbi:MAG: hypothetical protein Q8O67_29465 [Deltaproteobacteria bacterium]|nr:hypothetical protein [Deltaproteobacteria bacterium]
MGGPSYTRIPGSDRLQTGRRGAGAAAVVEGADRSSLARASVDVVGGARVTVGRVILRGASVPLLHDVVDRLFPLLQAEEVVVYVQLYRLAVDVDKNVCRVSRAELSRRTRLADRRLGRAIAGLVEKRAVVLIDRDRDGTLYRVMFPHEIFDEATAPTTVLPVAIDVVDVVAPVAPVADAPRSVGDVCVWFAARHGSGPGRKGADVAGLVLELLEEGHTFRQIPALLDAFVLKAPKTTPLRDLPRVLSSER